MSSTKNKKYYNPLTTYSKSGYLIPIKQDSNNTYYFTIGSVSYSNYKTLKGARIAIGKINPIY